MKKIIETNDVGVVAIENTVEGFLASLKEIMIRDYSELKKNVQVLKQKYNWEEQEKVLVDVYNSL